MSRPVVIFDGYCNLCSGTVQFFIRHNTARHLKFIPGQSAEGLALLNEYNLTTPETIVLLSGNRVFSESEAVLEIAKYLSFPWKMISVLKIFPAFIRDPVYRLIARNRYRWFGRRETCATVSDDEQVQ